MKFIFYLYILFKYIYIYSARFFVASCLYILRIFTSVIQALPNSFEERIGRMFKVIINTLFSKLAKYQLIYLNYNGVWIDFYFLLLSYLISFHSLCHFLFADCKISNSSWIIFTDASLMVVSFSFFIKKASRGSLAYFTSTWRSY